MILIQKNFGILICAMYFCLKSKRKEVDIKSIITMIMFSLIGGVIVAVLDNKMRAASVPVLLSLIFAFVCLLLREVATNALMITIIAYPISYAILMISAMLIGLLPFMLPYSFVEKNSQLLSLILQIVLIHIPFRIKRTKRGIEFIYNNIATFIIGLCVIYISMMLNTAKFDVYGVIYYLCAFILSILLFLYWRTAITRHYLERLSLRNIDSLNAELVEKTNYIKELEEDKARIEKLNHKNYKLIPAMEGAVMHYLDGVKSFVESNADNPAFAEFAAAKETDMAGFIDEGNRLLGELNKMLAEWEDIVHNDDIDGKKDLPVCGVTRVDYILSYMYERSLKENFVLKVDVDSELTGLTEKIITDEDLGTLIADLIENAIIATRYNNGKDILVRLGMMKKEYTIEVYDSGIPFDKEVLAKYGYEQITTHADDSGSGIGMMQTYEILSKCGASLFIDEFAEGEGMYTKRISVVFNKKHQYVLYTKRSDEEVAYLKKRSDLMIVRK